MLSRLGSPEPESSVVVVPDRAPRLHVRARTSPLPSRRERPADRHRAAGLGTSASEGRSVTAFRLLAGGTAEPWVPPRGCSHRPKGDPAMVELARSRERPVHGWHAPGGSPGLGARRVWIPRSRQATGASHAGPTKHRQTSHTGPTHQCPTSHRGATISHAPAREVDAFQVPLRPSERDPGGPMRGLVARLRWSPFQPQRKGLPAASPAWKRALPPAPSRRCASRSRCGGPHLPGRQAR